MSAEHPAESSRPSVPASPTKPGEPLLPDVTSDERDRGRGDGWGDEPSERDADWYRRERPPHHE